MKMSDVFSLPMEVGSSLNNVGTACTELADCDFYLADFRRENTLEEAHSMAKAAAYAINQHDALVAMNKELVEALKIAATAMDLKVLSACEITDVYCALAMAGS